MSQRRFWTITGLAGGVFWLVLSPALTVPGLRQGFPAAVIAALGVGLLAVLSQETWPSVEQAPKDEGEQGELHG